MKRFLAGLCLLCWLLSACAPKPAALPPGLAESTLREFFQALSDGNYAQAADLYGGSYNWLRSVNASVDPEDLPALWRAGCELNGLACLPVGRVLSVQKPGESEALVVVEFLQADGEVFTLGPCCGAEESGASPQHVFEYHLHAKNGYWHIMDMPVLIP
ncbi:MAG: hypothetical protein PWQ55_606 [Chloroflexota bacterium]|nr:hypothetical protein [Chloroflexota bacterium]